MKAVSSLLLFFLAAPAFAGHHSEVILGAGRLGTWDTEITVTNYWGQPMPVVISTGVSDGPETSGCAGQPAPCVEYLRETIPPLGTVVLSGIPLGAGGSSADVVPAPVYVAVDETLPLPAVTARMADTAADCSSGQSLPIVDTDGAYSSSPRSFPGARHDETGHVNLLLAAAPGEPDPVSIRVCVFDPGGTLIAARFFPVRDGHPILVGDVVALLGVPEMAQGMLLVDEPNGSAAFTAAMSIIGPKEFRIVSGRVLP
jgi:hypothetical protein